MLQSTTQPGDLTLQHVAGGGASDSPFGLVLSWA